MRLIDFVICSTRPKQKLNPSSEPKWCPFKSEVTKMKVKDILDITYCKNIFIVNTDDKVLWKLIEGICENPEDPSDELKEREVILINITQAGSLILFVSSYCYSDNRIIKID